MGSITNTPVSSKEQPNTLPMSDSDELVQHENLKNPIQKMEGYYEVDESLVDDMVGVLQDLCLKDSQAKFFENIPTSDPYVSRVVESCDELVDELEFQAAQRDAIREEQNVCSGDKMQTYSCCVYTQNNHTDNAWMPGFLIKGYCWLSSSADSKSVETVQKSDPRDSSVYERESNPKTYEGGWK